MTYVLECLQNTRHPRFAGRNGILMRGHAALLIGNTELNMICKKLWHIAFQGKVAPILSLFWQTTCVEHSAFTFTSAACRIFAYCMKHFIGDRRKLETLLAYSTISSCQRMLTGSSRF